jgi:hypothetical protein
MVTDFVVEFAQALQRSADLDGFHLRQA